MTADQPPRNPEPPQVPEAVLGVLAFLKEAERLKMVYRTSWTSDGRQESTAAHTWRLALSALVLAPHFPDVDAHRLLAMCIVHDLGEAIGGDIPAIYQDPKAPKSDQERRDLLTLLEPLAPAARSPIIELWDEYEAAATPTAKLAKALDKLETLTQHNQGANPPDFDYGFNLTYARRHTDAVPLIAAVRALVDVETQRLAGRSPTDG